LKSTICLIVCIFLLVLNSFSQIPSIEWQKSYGGNGSDGAYEIRQTPDGGYIVAGFTSSHDGDVINNSSSYYNYWILKLNSVGEIIWQKTLEQEMGGIAYSFCLNSDNSVVVVGLGGDVNGDSSGVLILKLMASGDVEWTRVIPDSIEETYPTGQSVIRVGDGYIICGNVLDNGMGGINDYIVLKTDTNGSLLWRKRFGGSENDESYSVKETNGGYIIAGFTNSLDGDITFNHNASTDYWIIKIDYSGNLLWQKTYGGSSSDMAYGIEVMSDGGFMVAGSVDCIDPFDGDLSNYYGSIDLWIIRLDSTGNLLWDKNLGGTGGDNAYSLVSTGDGHFLVTGVTDSYDIDLLGFNDPNGGLDYWVVEIDSEANIVWQKVMGGSNADLGEYAARTSDGGAIVCGYSYSTDGDITNHYYDNDMWVVKLAAPNSVNNIDAGIEIESYPNPANNILTVNVVTTAYQSVHLCLKNVLGQSYKNLSTLLYPGNNNLQVSTQELPAGVYYVTLSSDQFTRTKKVIIAH